MAASALQLSVITPEQQVLEQQADEVVIPAHDGELGILPQRAPLMCELGIGQLRFVAGGRTTRLFVDGGFAQVFENRVTVLTNRALLAAQIGKDVLAAAEKAVAASPGTDADKRVAYERDQRRLSVLRSLAGSGN
ncbi:MAG: ATP synthase F1 subunit epsilon [Phycisphaerales bacterium]|nr:ATP synthase F1 subunit epsilon [Phycisphaerales bacterium]